MFKIFSKLFVSLFLISGTFFFSCKKQDKPSDNQSQQKTTIAPRLVYGLDNIPIINNKQDINNLLRNPNDADDEKINHYLYELSKAIRELVKDASFNHIIIQMAQNEENNSANLLELKNIAPRYYDKINENLKKSGLSLSGIAADMTHKPINPNPEYPETSETEKYIPAIFIPNLDIINPVKQPIISPNIEIDARETEELDDYIVSWYYTKDLTLKEILLGEKTSLETSNPLFLLDNASPDIKANTVKIHAPENKGLKTMSTTSFHSNEYSINNGYAYEGWASGKSEFCIQAYRIDPYGTVHWIYSGAGWKKISEVKSADLGKTLSAWTLHCHNYTPYSSNYVFWNTYERDWNRSKKDLGTPNANGTQIYMYGRRKYTSEWYAWIPSTVDIHYTELNHIYWNWAKWYNSWKSNYRVWRVEL